MYLWKSESIMTSLEILNGNFNVRYVDLEDRKCHLEEFLFDFVTVGSFYDF